MALRSLYIGKILYGLLFCVALPVLLLVWASLLDINLPVDPSWKKTGISVMLTGSLLMTEAMWQLWKNGKGLPMNAFPPTRYVHQGSYRLFYHPIYVGFCLTCAGVSLYFLSPSGLYVVTPVMIILCSALVFGYENYSIAKRFGQIERYTFFGLAPADHEPADLKTKTGAFLSTFIPWLLLYQFIIYLGIDSNFINTVLPFESSWQVIEIAEVPYAITYLFIGLTPFIVKTNGQLREFQLLSWWIIASGIFLQFVFPFYSTPRPFVPEEWLGEMIMLERRYDGKSAAFPSFHVLWGLLGAATWSKAFPRLKMIWWILSILIALSCISVGVHSLADIASGVLLFVIITQRSRIWKWLNARTERLANSWREWHFGGFRIINHSLYAGLAGMVAVLSISQWNIDIKIIMVITFCVLAGGALWGQFVEGSPRLLRPFGYYGALAGGIIGLIICKILFLQPVVVTMAAIALGAPWVQAIGRLRCLVQGCCHGSITSNIGIRYSNEHSRVFQIPGFKKQNIHNTQLYSIAFNILIGLILLRLWYGNASPSLLAGLYFILGGAARFVEEAYRGEPQTKFVGGLRIYQWLAIVGVLTGIVITTLESTEPLILKPLLTTEIFISSAIAALAWAFGMGMDFPDSNIRFSRLSG